MLAGLFGGVLKFFTGFSLRQWLPIFVILGLGLSFWYNIYGYKKEIKNLNIDKSDLNRTIENMKKERYQLELEKYNLELVTKSLENEISNCNSNIERFRTVENNLTKTIEDLKKVSETKVTKEIIKKVTKDKKNPTCEEYKKLSEEISKLKYEDLAL